MRVFVSIDMEGVAGVATREQCRRTDPGYPPAATLMTLEANAAVLGAFEGGADTVLVNDSHADMWNLDLELLDDRVELVLGSPRVPVSMAAGVEDADLALFVGYHASGGHVGGCLAHTYSGACFYDVRVDGTPVNEAWLNARYAGEHGVPVGLVVGDEALARELTTFDHRLPGLSVKRGLGRTAVQSLHPGAARRAIQSAAAAAVRDRSGFRPMVTPFSELSVDLLHIGMAELCELVPGTRRTGGRTVSYQTTDITELHRVMNAWMYLASEAL